MTLKNGDVVEYISNKIIFGIVILKQGSTDKIFVRYFYREDNMHHFTATYDSMTHLSSFWRGAKI